MRKLMLITALFSVFFVNAQEAKFGVKAGLNLSTINTTDASIAVQPDNKSLLGFHLGGFAEIRFSKKFGIQPELLFSAQGSKSEYNFTDVENLTGGAVVTTTDEDKTTLKTSYLNLPILAKFYATEKLFFVAGPQLGFLLSAKSDFSGSTTVSTLGVGGTTTVVTNSDSSTDVKKFTKGLNVSFGLGGGYFFTDNLFAEARYTIGLTNDTKSEDDVNLGVVSISSEVSKTNVFQVSVGYRF